MGLGWQVHQHPTCTLIDAANTYIFDGRQLCLRGSKIQSKKSISAAKNFPPFISFLRRSFEFAHVQLVSLWLWNFVFRYLYILLYLTCQPRTTLFTLNCREWFLFCEHHEHRFKESKRTYTKQRWNSDTNCFNYNHFVDIDNYGSLCLLYHGRNRSFFLIW